MLEFWGDVGFLAFTFSTLVFTAMYLTLSRWRKSFVGTVIAIFAVSVLILCAYLSLRIWNVSLPGVEWVRLTIFWVLAITMLTSIVGFFQVQFGKRGQKLRKRLSGQYDDVTHGK